jgi:hypothetical protein
MKAFVLSVPLAALVFAACATPPTTPAPWAETPQALRQMFPDGEYIAQRGRGKTRAAAEAAAALEIARYITSQVSGTQGYRMTSTETNGRGAEKTETVNEARVKTEIDLFGIRYADGAFYDAARREWHAAAYIEREDAWQVYKPRVQAQADSFLKLYNAAETEEDTFKKVMRYETANAYTAKDEFTNAFIFGQILSPSDMNRDYAAVRAAVSALPQKIDNAKRGATVYIDCSPDFEERITQAFAECFRAQGFAVSKTQSGAAAVCEVTVSEGEQKRELGVFYHPSLRAELRGKSGVLASFTVQGEGAQAVTPEVAKRRAYTALAESVRLQLAAQLVTQN